jgi:hypothetical protein
LKKYFYFISRKNGTELSGREGRRERDKVKKCFYFISRKKRPERSGAERR